MFSAPLLADATHGLGAPSGGCVCCYVFYSRQGREVEPVAGHGDSAAALLTAAGKGGVGEAPWRQSWRTAVQPRLFSQRRAGGAVVGEAPMEAVPEDGGSAAALLVAPGKAANMCLHVLGLKPATLDPARNKGGATIHTICCLCRFDLFLDGNFVVCLNERICSSGFSLPVNSVVANFF